VSVALNYFSILIALTSGRVVSLSAPAAKTVGLLEDWPHGLSETVVAVYMGENYGVCVGAHNALSLRVLPPSLPAVPVRPSRCVFSDVAHVWSVRLPVSV
jgi:hypothetical protein